MWKKIENLPEQYMYSKKMFVAKAIDIPPFEGSPYKYTTDPYCVWLFIDGNYSRWPHAFPPTHYCELSEEVE